MSKLVFYANWFTLLRRVTLGLPGSSIVTRKVQGNRFSLSKHWSSSANAQTKIKCVNMYIVIKSWQLTFLAQS